ncbi:MAG: sugar phosphate isomerase/epimerase, partial [Propionibacteriaceae bacterium]
MCIGDEQAQHLDLPPTEPDGHRHDVSRRGVLRAAAVGAAALGLSGGTAVAANAQQPAAAAKPHHLPASKISIQLYTLRDQLQEDLEGTVESLADIGYRRVEHAGFVGRNVKEFKAALDAVGIRATSGHVAIPQPFDADTWAASLRDARTLGSRYIVNPVYGINFGTGAVVRDRATWTAFARDLNRAGRMAKKAGIRLGYHNHNWEFFSLLDEPRHHRLRRAPRGDGPALRPPRDGPLLGHPGRARPGRPREPPRPPGPAVPRQGPGPGGV